MLEATHSEILYSVVIGIALSLAVIEDLKTKKIKNKHVIIFFSIALMLKLFTSGISGLVVGLSSSAAIFIVMLPLVLMKIVGGGDYKLMIAAASLMSWKLALNSLFFSLFWGAIFGLIQIILKKELIPFLFNYRLLLNRNTRSDIKTHSIPFTVALLLGWAFSLTLELRGLVWLF